MLPCGTVRRCGEGLVEEDGEGAMQMSIQMRAIPDMGVLTRLLSVSQNDRGVCLHQGRKNAARPR
jgi:hypothetical protein